MTSAIAIHESSGAPAGVPFDGVAVRLAGRDYVVPPLTLGALKRLMPKIRGGIAGDGGVLAPEQIDNALDVLFAAFVRNYPSLTRDALAEIVDVAALATLFPAVMGASGLAVVRGAGAAGEAAPAPAATEAPAPR